MTTEKKLVTISTYAKMYGITRQAAFYRVKNGKLKTKTIDGKTFVIV